MARKKSSKKRARVALMPRAYPRDPPFPATPNMPPPIDQGSTAWWAWLRDYYASEAWKARIEHKLRCEPVCQHCGRRPATTVHHLHYDTLGRELTSRDLKSRCNHCHEIFHKLARL